MDFKKNKYKWIWKGEQLKERLKEFNVKTTEFASLVGVSYNMISLVYRGYVPKLDLQMKIDKVIKQLELERKAK